MSSQQPDGDFLRSSAIRLIPILLAAPFQASDCKDNFRAQVQEVFENLRAAVEAAGGDFNSVIKLNYYCAESVDPSQITTVREIRDKYVNTANPPASTFAS